MSKSPTGERIVNSYTKVGMAPEFVAVAPLVRLKGGVGTC